MSLFNGIPDPIGSEEWIVAAEKAEWLFMAQMLDEARKELQGRGYNMSGLGVAYDIAMARSKSGWRTYSTAQQRADTSSASEIPGTDTKTGGVQ